MDLLKQNNSSFNSNVLNQAKILYVEDDELIRKETLNIFENFFKKVYVAQDGKEGLDSYYKNRDKIDIILTDINMPNMNGIELISKVREEDFELPILVVTAFNDVSLLIKLIKLNVSDYILKPMQMNSTLKVIDKIVTNRFNQKLVFKQKNELQIYKDILDKENLVSETDLKGIVTYANDIFCEVSGYSKDELIGANHNIVRHPDVSPKVYKKLWETIQSKKVWKGKIKNRAKDGTPYYVKATIFPILDENENIEKYVASRFLITEDEEERHKLKKYIVHQKSQQIKYEKQLQEDFDDALHYAKMQKDKQVANFIHELNEQIKSLRGKNSDNKGRILFLENQLKDAVDKNENMVKNYQEKVEKLHTTAIKAAEEYQRIKKRDDIITEKLEKSQEAIKTLQGYIDEYRKKISNLEDVIASYEKDKAKKSNT
ncbi:response regulator [Halarcobacter anaerophilus]|uniref:response regulator n=1 Tax=Halarcobacter anaerophilus TaxID=877500 RepID=UPI0005C8B445|nr:response regulator [Halarcobacter anaerophilus]